VRTTAEVLPAPPRDAVFTTPACGKAGIPIQVTGSAANPYRSLLLTGKDLSQGPLAIDPISAVLMGVPTQIQPQVPDFSFRTSFNIPAGTAPGGYVFVVGGQQSTFVLPCPSPDNYAPVADAGGPYRGVPGSPVAFDGSRSSDREGSPLTYMWDFGDNTTGTGVKPQHVYASEGTYLVTLVVNDGAKSSYPNVGSRSFAGATITRPVCTLSGFYPPVDMSTFSSVVWNTVKAGSTVPLKFECFDGGTELTDPAVIIQPLTAQVVACISGAEDAVDGLTATGGTSLRYDAAAGQFVYNWQTPGASGVCYRVSVEAKGGSSLSAYFKTR
jgi:PKD domain